MKMNRVSPCQNCPFRYDVAPFITAVRTVEIIDSIVDHQQSFPCHKTTRFDDDDDDDDGDEVRIFHSDEQHCAGAMIMLEKMERPNQWMRIAERLGFYDRHKLKMDAPVYDNGDAMIHAHEDAE